MGLSRKEIDNITAPMIANLDQNGFQAGHADQIGRYMRHWLRIGDVNTASAMIALADVLYFLGMADAADHVNDACEIVARKGLDYRG